MTFVLDLLYAIATLVLGPPWWIVRRVRRRPVAPLLSRTGAVEAPPPGSGPVVWFHAVSVGEALAVRGVVRELSARWPGLRPLVTCTTVAGLNVARESLPGVPVRPAPYDFGFAVRRFLRRVQPELLVLVETELWPNLLRLCRHAGIPIAVVNAKVSAGSSRGYRLLARSGVLPLSAVRLWLAQSGTQVRRIAAMGVPESRIVETGNLKFDSAGREAGPDTRGILRRQHGFPAAARILVAGSTHPGEEDALLGAAAELRARDPMFRLVLAPRHPERLPAVLEACRRSGTGVPGLRSRPGEPPDPAVLVVDGIGELSMLYALGDAAFVGGTLVPVGGHNLLEPAALGLPIVVGRYLDTVRETAAALSDAGALRIVTEVRDLGPTVEALLGDAEAMRRAASGAREVITTHRGSVARTVEALTALLRPPAPPLES